MLTTYFKSSFAKLISFPDLRESVKIVANEFSDPNFRSFFLRWGDNMYKEAMSIKDEKKHEEFQRIVSDDYEAIKRQAVIQKLYKDVKID